MSIQSILDRNSGEVITIRATETVKTAAECVCWDARAEAAATALPLQNRHASVK
jgi:hypothetical protein